MSFCTKHSIRVLLRLPIVILFFCMPIALWSQNIRDDVYTSFINLNKENGLSNNRITDLYQDINGYIWVATIDGLNRFDGNKFIIFRNSVDDSLSISSNHISSIAGDSKGNIWVGTNKGLNKYCPSTGNFIRYTSNPILAHTLRNNHIRKILLESDTSLWIETIDGTLSHLNMNSGNFEHYSHRPIHQPDYLYHTLWQDDNGDIWIGGRNLEIHILDRTKKTFRLIAADATNPHKKRDDDLAAVAKSKDGRYYASATDGFYRFDPKTEIFEKLYATSTFSLSALPNNSILMGTGKGLVIYNPSTNGFKRYLNDAANPKSLINNHINKVLVDKAGNIWAGTNEGISILKRLETEINNYFYIPDSPKSLSSNRISALLQDRKKRIWIGTDDQGLNLWDRNTNTFKHFKHDAANPNSISSNRITKIYEDRNGDLWIGLWSGIGFNKFYPEKNKFVRYALLKDSRKTDWYNDILEDSKGNFWLGFWGSRGFQSFDRKKEEFSSTHYYSQHVPINLSVEKLINDGEGNIFIQTNIPYVYDYNPKTNLFKAHISKNKFATDPINYKYFSADLPIDPSNIYAIETNKKGITLFATDSGLLAFQAKTQKFYDLNNKTTYKHIVYNKERKLFYALSNNTISTINDSLAFVSTKQLEDSINALQEVKLVCDSRNNIWMPTSSGIFRLNPENGLINKMDLGIGEDQFNKARFASTENYILISSDKGLMKIDSKDLSKRTKIDFSSNPAFLSKINHLAKLDNNQVLIISVYGIGLLDPKTDQIEFIDIDSTPSDFGYNVNSISEYENKLFLASNISMYELDLNRAKKRLIRINNPDQYMVSSRLTTCILEDGNTDLWIGTSDGGLNRLHTKTQVFDHFTKENSVLPSNEILCLFLDAKNTLWIGTTEGLCSFDKETEQLLLHSKQWEAKRIESMISDSDSMLWIGTDHGLIRYNTQTSQHQVFLNADGFPTNSYNKGAILLDNGQAVFSSNQGIVTFNPKELTVSNRSKKVEITEFNLFNEPIHLNIRSGDTIKLSYNKNLFSIDYSTLNFESPNSVHYSYTISGMGNKWITSTTPSATFTNLPAGEYLFRVCQQGFEDQPDFQSKLYIFIAPPFYKTWWFVLLNIILIGSIGLIVLIGYIKQIKISERNAKLEQKLLTSQMNPHFIFNSLSAIQSFIYKKDAEVAGNYLSDFSSLVRLILENSRSELVALEKEIKTLHLYLRLQQLRFMDRFDYELFIDDKINTKTTFIPPMLAQPFIENAIEHGIMHLKTKGFISIRFGLKADVISMEVIDDGIGLKRSKLINQKRETHTSYATSITYERLTNLTRRGNKNIDIVIEDRSDKENVSGTRVYLEVPYKTIGVKINKQ